MQQLLSSSAHNGHSTFKLNYALKYVTDELLLGLIYTTLYQGLHLNCLSIDVSFPLDRLA